MKNFAVRMAVVFMVAGLGCGRELAEAPSAMSNGATAPVQVQNSAGSEEAQRCAIGDKAACNLLARAFERGDPLASTAAPVVQNFSKAAYYYSKACELGHMFACLALGDFYRKGRGVEKSYPDAARLFSEVCDHGPDPARMFGCTALGESYVKGNGVKRNRERGLSLLDRSCSMGETSACELHKVFAGTGLVCQHEAPIGAMGFAFDASREEAGRLCAEMNGRWYSVKSGTGCEAKIDALGSSATIVLTFHNERLASIDGFVDAAPGQLVREFNRIGDILWKTYGTPSRNYFDVPDECAADVPRCVQSEKALLVMYWEFKSHHAIQLQAVTTPTGSAVSLEYVNPVAFKEMQIKGL